MPCNVPHQNGGQHATETGIRDRNSIIFLLSSSVTSATARHGALKQQQEIVQKGRLEPRPQPGGIPGGGGGKPRGKGDGMRAGPCSIGGPSKGIPGAGGMPAAGCTPAAGGMPIASCMPPIKCMTPDWGMPPEGAMPPGRDMPPEGGMPTADGMPTVGGMPATGGIPGRNCALADGGMLDACSIVPALGARAAAALGARQVALPGTGAARPSAGNAASGNGAAAVALVPAGAPTVVVGIGFVPRVGLAPRKQRKHWNFEAKLWAPQTLQNQSPGRRSAIGAVTGAGKGGVAVGAGRPCIAIIPGGMPGGNPGGSWLGAAPKPNTGAIGEASCFRAAANAATRAAASSIKLERFASPPRGEGALCGEAARRTAATLRLPDLLRLPRLLARDCGRLALRPFRCERRGEAVASLVRLALPLDWLRRRRLELRLFRLLLFRLRLSLRRLRLLRARLRLRLRLRFRLRLRLWLRLRFWLRVRLRFRLRLQLRLQLLPFRDLDLLLLRLLVDPPRFFFGGVLFRAFEGDRRLLRLLGRFEASAPLEELLRHLSFSLSVSSGPVFCCSSSLTSLCWCSPSPRISSVAFSAISLSSSRAPSSSLASL